MPSRPEDFARALLAKFKISKVNLTELASRIGLRIREVESIGFEGALIRVPNKPIGIIAVKKDIREPGRKRFTIGHEMGHYFLPGHGDTVCKSVDIGLSKGGSEQEIDANRFASELLLPTDQIRPIIQRESATIAVAKRISADYETSLTATVLKCIEVTEENCALVVTVNGVIDWVKPSPHFQYYIEKGIALHMHSLASKLSVESGNIEEDGSVPAEAWIRDSWVPSDARVWEDSILLPYYNKILTIITITTPFT